MNTLTITGNSFPLTQSISDDTRNFVTESTAASTRKAYRSDLTIFVGWCESMNLESLPASPATIANFLAHQANGGISPSTLNRRIAAIRYAHEAAGINTPTGDKLVASTLKGIPHHANRARKPHRNPL
jgi:hypothetical protein